MADILVYDPAAPVADATSQSGARFDNLQGKVVGFIDNAKPNFGVLAEDIGELLKTKLGVARVVKHRKPSASVPARPEVIEALSAECDVVITGSGD